MDASYLSLLRELGVAYPDVEYEINSDSNNVVDLMLKALIDEVTAFSIKCNLLLLLELQSTQLLKEIHDVELVLTTVKNVFNSSNNNAVQGQCLVSTTAILLEMSEKFSGGEFDSLFSQHINHLLDIINAVNVADNVYVRSVAADSLLEVEICYPLLLKPCLENVCTATMKENSAAHQQYSCLLSLIMKHNTAHNKLDTPLWNRYPEVVLDSKFLNLKNASLATSVQSNNQLVSFLVDQLPYCNPEGVVWITHQTVDLLLHNTELRASCRMLKPLFFNSVYTFNCAVFHLLLYLEKVFGRELFEDEEHALILKQLLLNCSHPSLPQSIVHIYFEFLNDYLSRVSHQLKFASDVSVLLPSQFDCPDTHLRKFVILSNVLKHKTGSSPFLLKVINNIQNEAKRAKCPKYKSVLMKILFKFLSDYEDVKYEDIVRIVVVATADDVTIVPFLLHFIRFLQSTFPTSGLPAFILSSLVNVYTQADSFVDITTLAYIIDIFQESISKKSGDCLKSILVYLYKFLIFNGAYETISWSLGHKVLKLCCTAMKEYDTSSFFYEINNLLQVLISKCINDDVQDRASLYLNLLQSLSDKKLKIIMQGPKQALPCAPSGDNNYSSQSSLEKLEKPIVCVLKVKRVSQSDEGFFVPDEDSNDMVSSYRQFLGSNESLRKLIVRVLVKISPDYGHLQCVEALVLFIEVPETWGRIDPVIVGHVKEDDLIDKRKKNVFEMTCHPINPLPIQVQIRAQFSLENIYHMRSLDPLEIEFQDFFRVIPVKVNSKIKFFEEFWVVLKNDYESVMFLKNSEEAVKSVLEKEFEPFIMHKDGANYYVGIFLPSNYHILMKCEFKQLNTTVTFVTDCLCLLSLVNYFFKNICTS